MFVDVRKELSKKIFKDRHFRRIKNDEICVDTFKNAFRPLITEDIKYQMYVTC